MNGVVLLLAALPRLEAPPPELWELNRFPPAEATREVRAFAQEHRAWLHQRTKDAEYTPEWFAWKAWTTEQEALYAAWDALHDAHERGKPTAWVAGQRTALRTLRARLSPQQWALGEMPAPVPVGRLWRVD